MWTKLTVNQTIQLQNSGNCSAQRIRSKKVQNSGQKKSEVLEDILTGFIRPVDEASPPADEASSFGLLLFYAQKGRLIQL